MLSLGRVRFVLLFIGLISVITALGCESVNPVDPAPSAELATVGELKKQGQEGNDDNSLATATGPQLVSYGVAEVVPGAPELLLIQETNEDIKSFEHVDDIGGNELFRFEMADGRHVPKGCNLKFTANGENIGSLIVPKNLTYGNIRLLDSDLPTGEITIVMSIVCNGTVAATIEAVIDRPATTNPSNILLIGDGDNSNNDDEQTLLEAYDAYLGNNRRYVVVEFEDLVDVTNSARQNVSVVSQDTNINYPVVSFDEKMDTVIFIVRKDLPAGEYAIAYNGQGGLRGRTDRKKVKKFKFAFTVEEDLPNIKDAIASRSSVVIPHGLYAAGSTLLIALDHFKYKVSDWTRGSLSNPAFNVEDAKGETEVLFVTGTDIGLVPGHYTSRDIISAVVGAGYSLLPAETAAQLRLIYPDQPNNQVVVMVSAPISNLITGQQYLQMLGREDHVAPGLWLTSLEINGVHKLRYSLFAVGR